MKYPMILSRIVSVIFFFFSRISSSCGDFIFAKIEINNVGIILPMIFMVFFSAWGIILNMFHFTSNGKWLLAIISGLLLCFEAWMIIEEIICAKKNIKRIFVN